MHKKISKFEREDKCNGIPLLHHGFFFFFHEKFPIYIQKDSLHLFISCCVRISRTMNAKNLKIRGEDKRNGIPLLHPGLFFFFDEIFPLYIQKDSLQFFFMPCSYFQKNECKKISKFEREDKRNGIPLLHHGFSFLSREIFRHTFRSTKV